MCLFVNSQTGQYLEQKYTQFFILFININKEIVLETRILLKQHKFYVDTRNSLNVLEHTYLYLVMANVNIDVLQQVTN